MAQSFTIRNKASDRPIMTIGKKLLALMLASSPEAVALALNKYKADYRRVTGKSISIDHEQQLILFKHYGADSDGNWTSKFTMNPLVPIFTSGFLYRSLSFIEDDIILAEKFFKLLEESNGVSCTITQCLTDKGASQQPIPINEINAWATARIRAAGPEGIQDQLAFVEECVRYAEAKHNITFKE